MGLWRGGAPSSGGTPGGIRDEEDEYGDFEFDDLEVGQSGGTPGSIGDEEDFDEDDDVDDDIGGETK